VIFSEQITQTLFQWLFSRIDYPYPTAAEKQALAEQTGLTVEQVSNW